MADRSKVELVFAGDSTDLERKFDAVGSGARDLEGDFGKAERSAEDLQQAFRETGSAARELDSVNVDGLNTSLVNAAAAGDVTERAFIGVADLADVMSDRFGIGSPIIGEWGRSLADVGGATASLLPLIGQAPAMIGKVAASIVPAIAGTWAYVAALTAQTVAFIAANAPIILIIGSIALLVAGIVLLVKHWDEIEPHVQPAIDIFEKAKAVIVGVYEWIRDNWPLLLAILTGPIGLAVLAIVTHWDTIKDGFAGVKDWIEEKVGDIVGFFGDMPGDILAAMGDFGGLLKGAGTALIQGLIDGILDMLEPLTSAVERVMGPVKAVKNFLGGGGGDSQVITDMVNRSLGIAPSNMGAGLGGMPTSFHGGGVVPGMPGQEVLALLRAGETVLPTSSGMGGNLTITVNALDARSAAAAVIDAINEHERRNGRRYARA